VPTLPGRIVSHMIRSTIPAFVVPSNSKRGLQKRRWRCRALIFIRDPMNAHPQEPDIATPTRSCDVHNIPYATKTASAGLILPELEEYGPRQ
jgi:hypothetical protein